MIVNCSFNILAVESRGSKEVDKNAYKLLFNLIASKIVLLANCGFCRL